MRADNRTVLQLLMLLAALLFIGPASSAARVKFANFIKMSHQNSRDLTTVKVENEGQEIAAVTSLEVTNYHLIANESSLVVFKVMSRSYNFTLNTSVSCQLTIYFYWNSQLVITQLEDIEKPKLAFSEIAKASKIRFPYENNTFWRLVLINPFRKDLYPMIHHRVGDRKLVKRPSRYSPGLLYFQDSAYSTRTIGIYDPIDPLTPIKEIENQEFYSQGIYTLYLLMDGANLYFTTSEDLQPENRVVPLVFIVIYMMIWGIFRSISSYQLRSRGKKKFYVVKSIRVETKEQRDLNFLADEIPAVDTMRGLAVIMFIFGRSGGAGYRFFNESVWDGFTLGDFPKFFISWIMGFSTSLSLSKKRDEKPSLLVKGLLLKCGIMFLLGSPH
jgi:hypothetical protein